jgi:hypothetical protein
MRVSIKRSDGGVSIMNVLEGTSVEQEITKWTPEQQALVVSWRELSDDELPADRYFRSAWKDVGKIEVDMPKARDIHRDRLREMRAPKLAALDIEYQRADEAGDAERKRAIAAQKQALRDVTADPAIDAAQTPDELKAVVPVILKP